MSSVSPLAERAQSEVVGVAILTGITLVLALSVGAVIISQTIGTEDGPTTDVAFSASNENVTFVHNGGDSLALADLTIRLEQADTTKAFTPSATNTTGGDAVLEPSEYVRREHGFPPGDVEVLVVHEPSSSVLLDDHDTIPA